MATTSNSPSQNKKALNFELVSPAKVEVRSMEEKIVMPGVDGDFMVLPGHTRLITNLRHGVLRVIRGDQDAHQIYVTGGFADIGPDHCTVLASQAIPVHQLNKVDLEERLALLTEDLKESDEENSKKMAQEISDIEQKLKILESL